MSKVYFRFRVFLMMMALGLASFTFFNALSAKWIDSSINLPQIDSASPIIIFARNRDDTPPEGSSGPDDPGSFETINTLGTGSGNKILENVELQGAKFQGADLSGANISNSDFGNADLSGANLTKSEIYYSSFIKSNLSNANFTGAKLHGSDLTNAKLNNTKFVRANLTHSDFSNANLVNADLTDTNLSDASLETAKGLTYKQIQRALINEFTSLPPHLISKRIHLMEQSRRKVIRLRKEMSEKELQLYIHPFNFLD